jgi:hypothetical protein
LTVALSAVIRPLCTPLCPLCVTACPTYPAPKPVIGARTPVCTFTALGLATAAFAS